MASINKRNAKRLAYLTALLVLTVLALSIGIMTADAQRQRVVTVTIRDFYFEPSQLVIEPGTAVHPFTTMR